MWAAPVYGLCRTRQRALRWHGAVHGLCSNLRISVHSPKLKPVLSNRCSLFLTTRGLTVRTCILPCLLTFMLWPAPTLRAQAYRIGVDSRVELMSVLFRLAGNDEYNQCRVPAYDRALEAYFARYRNHEAVQLARTLEIGFDAPMSLAVHVRDVESLAERVPFHRPGIHLDTRWRGAKARRFLAAARKFVVDTKFVEFVTSQRSLYEETSTRLRQFVQGNADMLWYRSFFGGASRVRLIVVPGMANGGPSYGASIIAEDGVEEIYAIPGVAKVDDDGLPQFSVTSRNTLVHEFIHAYVNPLVDKFAPQMEDAARQINKTVQRQMKSQGYGTWKSLLYESMTRACTVQYVLEHDGPDSASRLIQKELSNSFYWVGDLADVLAEYKANRQQYPTLETFMPKIVQFFVESDRWLAREI